MTVLTATHEPFLKSSAQLLILPMSSDGTVLHPILARTKTLFPSNHTAYRTACKDGILLGDILVHRVQREQMGLGVGSRHGADYIINLTTTTHAHHSTQASTVKACFDKLAPALYELIRYKGLRRAALLTHPMLPLSTSAMPQDNLPRLNINELGQILTAFTLPKLSLDVHMDRQLELMTFHSEA